MNNHASWSENEIDELDDLITRAESTPWGKTCSALWAQAATVALENEEYEEAIRCYIDLITAYMQGGESTRVIAPFAWLERNLREHPEWFDGVELPGYDHDLFQQIGWMYKYVFSAVLALPNVSVDQCEQILDRMRAFYQSQSDPLRSWYFRKYELLKSLGEEEKAEEFYQQWRTSECSELSDCPQCDPTHEVDFYCEAQQWQQAIDVGTPALHVKSICSEQPEQLMESLIFPWLYAGQDHKAWAAHVQCYRRYQQAPRFFNHIHHHLTYLTISGRAGRPERLERGVSMLQRHLPWMSEAETPRDLFRFAQAAALLLASFSADRDDEILQAILPGTELTWITCPQLTRPTYRQAREWFVQLSYDLADQFAQRPGHPHPEYERERLVAAWHPTPAPMPESESAIPDVSGMFYEMSTADLTAPEASSSTPSASSSDTEPEDNDPESTENSESEMPALRAEDLHGMWQDLTLAELVARGASLGSTSHSIYYMQACELLAADSQNDELMAEACQQLDLSNPAVAEQWSQLQKAADFIAGTNNAGTNDAGEEQQAADPAQSATDPAIILLIQAKQKMLDADYMTAAQLADQALRTPSIDTLGTHLQALAILSDAATKAGYYSEAIESARESVNISAAAQFPYHQVRSAAELAYLLGKTQRWDEMAEVAQNALDTVDRYHLTGQIIPALHQLLARASDKLDHDETAAIHMELCARALPESDKTKIDALINAAKAFRNAHLFPDAIRVWHTITGMTEKVFAEAQQNYVQRHALHADDAKAQERVVNAFAQALKLRIFSLYQFSECIVMQPGIVPDPDIALMETQMNALRMLITNPEHSQFVGHTPQWQEADWYDDMGHMNIMSYRYGLAHDYLTMAIAEFEKINDLEKATLSRCRLAHMYLNLNQLDIARELIAELVEIAQKLPPGSQARSYIRKLNENLEK